MAPHHLQTTRGPTMQRDGTQGRVDRPSESTALFRVVVPLLGLWALIGLGACGDHSNVSGSDAALDGTVDGGIDGTVDGDQTTCTTRSPEPGLVITTEGAIQGTDKSGVYAFLGIPYAEPPVGDLRWAPPEPHGCLADPFVADQFGPECPQLDQDGNPAGDEDCLSVNVWTPSNYDPTDPTLPVLFFIHGGGNVAGSSSIKLNNTYLYDGGPLARQRHVVVVTINYRLGNLGYLTDPALAAQDPRGVSGNYGLLDQQLALRWVQENIAAFGGDPSHVLLFGESGGATDVCIHVASPLAAGLFTAAIIESGGCGVDDASEVVKGNADFVTATGCQDADPQKTVTCLRNLDVTTVLNTVPAKDPIKDGFGRMTEKRYVAVVDGQLLVTSPIDALAKDEHNHVPIVFGVNSAEAAFWLTKQVTAKAYEAWVHDTFDPPYDSQILTFYPSQGDQSRKSTIALMTDLAFICPARHMARNAARGQSEPVYRYYFSRILDVAHADFTGAWHTLELPYIFNTLSIMSWYTPTEADARLSSAMQMYWTSAAKSGRPDDVDGLPAWPMYEAPAAGKEWTDPYVILDDPISSGEGLHTAKCDMWDEYQGIPKE